jgi:hypothetical protein
VLRIISEPEMEEATGGQENYMRGFIFFHNLCSIANIIAVISLGGRGDVAWV